MTGGTVTFASSFQASWWAARSAIDSAERGLSEEEWAWFLAMLTDLTARLNARRLGRAA